MMTGFRRRTVADAGVYSFLRTTQSVLAHTFCRITIVYF